MFVGEVPEELGVVLATIEVPAATVKLGLVGLVAVRLEFVLPTEIVVFESVAGTGGANEMPEMVRLFTAGSVLLNEKVGSEPVAMPALPCALDPLSVLVCDTEPASDVSTWKLLPLEEKSPCDELVGLG
ncbi:hypothetical protein GALL_533560 [mine drainage metagenome]|uniref:Uncharacterized protein n=1 Tax=mine drainage metagenome TaxID=410659 RepID=A0A1J5P350_9ZZZZ